MKQGNATILQPAQEAYIERLLPPRDAVLREMEEHAARENIPISDPEVGLLLSILARAIGARRILEIGAAIGYGTLWLARGAAEAEIVAIDVDPGRLAAARGYLQRAGVADRVDLRQGPALEVLSGISGPFDLAYIDAVKLEYRRYLDLLLPRLRVGGLVLADNLLWKGRVADPTPEQDEEADALRAFNGYLMIHPQLQSVVLPLGDGLGGPF
jgi:caffeoyl-CoA O-methyltransferase